MDAKDILRIALFLLVAIFALRSGSVVRVRGSARISNPSKTEDTETQQLLQHVQDSRKKINQEPMVYENQAAGKEISM